MAEIRCHAFNVTPLAQHSLGERFCNTCSSHSLKTTPAMFWLTAGQHYEDPFALFWFALLPVWVALLQIDLLTKFLKKVQVMWAKQIDGQMVGPSIATIWHAVYNIHGAPSSLIGSGLYCTESQVHCTIFHVLFHVQLPLCINKKQRTSQTSQTQHYSHSTLSITSLCLLHLHLCANVIVVSHFVPIWLGTHASGCQRKTIIALSLFSRLVLVETTLIAVQSESLLLAVHNTFHCFATTILSELTFSPQSLLVLRERFPSFDSFSTLIPLSPELTSLVSLSHVTFCTIATTAVDWSEMSLPLYKFISPFVPLNSTIQVDLFNWQVIGTLVPIVFTWSPMCPSLLRHGTTTVSESYVNTAPMANFVWCSQH